MLIPITRLTTAFMAHVNPQTGSAMDHFLLHVIEVSLVVGAAMLVATLVIRQVRRKN